MNFRMVSTWPYMKYWMRYRQPSQGMSLWSSFYPFTEGQEITLLQVESQILEDTRAKIRKRIEELKKKETK